MKQRVFYLPKLLAMAFFLTLIVPSVLSAQETLSPRVALVIGNAQYSGSISALANPGNDARDIALKLQNNGWKVILSENAERKDMNRRLAEFSDALKTNPGSTALFFYAGHGLQIEGKNYLLPVNEEFETASDVKDSAFFVDRVVDVFIDANVRQSVIILDACRDNPFARKSRTITGSRGLAVVPVNENAEEG